MKNGSEKVSAAISSELHARLAAAARANDRSMSAELRRALAAYLDRSFSESDDRRAKAAA